MTLRRLEALRGGGGVAFEVAIFEYDPYMKISSGVSIAFYVMASVLGFGLVGGHHVNTVSAAVPQASEFFRTFDPGPLLTKYGTVRSHGSSATANAGSPESTSMRGLTVNVVLPASQVAALTQELRTEIETRLQAQGRIVGRSQDSGEYSYEYDSGNSWGFCILERIEPEAPRGDDGATWRVLVRIIERVHQ
jgi:hypothetical protein